MLHLGKSSMHTGKRDLRSGWVVPGFFVLCQYLAIICILDIINEV